MQLCNPIKRAALLTLLFGLAIFIGGGQNICTNICPRSYAA